MLEESAPLELCAAYFYRWSIVYDIVDAARGVHLGEPRFVMASQSRTSTGALESALCLAPSSTPWGEG